MPAPQISPSSPIQKTNSGAPTTALQAHVAFFDRDGDGIIWPTDTYSCFREIKFGLFLSLLSTCIIHFGFSWFTFGTWLPDPFFRLKVEYMHRGKHGSDSESYNKLGEFDEARFDHIFKHNTQYPHTRMSMLEGIQMIHGNRNPFDPFGWFATCFEWIATYILLWPEDGYMAKKDVRDVFDGSIFYRISGRPKQQENGFKTK